MCGIVGQIDGAGLDAAAPARLDAALERLRPRGPDGHGRWNDERCLLGHARLAIIDLSPGGAQPMARDGLVVTFNGEIYNYAALRAELEALGWTFRSRSDTEVLLVGWRQWGAALLPRLHGMFAFALWDAATGQAVLVRDRLGKKPLCWRADGRRLTFSSDLKALRRLSPGGETIDPQAVRLLFALRYIPEPWTILSQVRKLPPGHLLRFDAVNGGATVERWWDGPRPRRPVFTDPAEAASELRATFDAAVGERLVADVPVGAFLSGGIDSACVVASMVAQGHAVRSFTVGFPDGGAYYEERPAARRVAEYLGLDHTEVAIDGATARAAIDAVLEGCDEPFADSSALPQFLLARETRRHVTVALSGDGADEVFGGYRKYRGEIYADAYGRLPGWLRDGVVAPLLNSLPERKDNRLLELVRRARRFAAHAAKSPVQRQAGWMRLLDEAELDGLLGPGGPTVEALVAAARAEQCGDDPINAMLFADIRLGLGGDMLAKVDRMTMAASLEVRCPFLDHRVVECAAAMPGAFKLSGRAGKIVLRQAFGERLPEDVFTLPKKGFEMPIARWLTDDLADLARWAVDPAALAAEGWLNPQVPGRWLEDLRDGRRDTAWHLWTLIAFRRWLEEWR